MKLTKFLSLSAQDFLKGLIIAPSIEHNEFIFNWTTIWHTAVASALAYLAKNLLSPTPKSVQIDPEKTSVIDKNTKGVIINAEKE